MFAQSFRFVFTFCLSASAHVIIMFSVSRFVCLRVFCVVISLTSFMLSSCLRSLFSFLHFCVSCCICDGIHADVAETALILYDHCCVFMWDKKFGKLLLRGIAQVELCRDSVLIPFSFGLSKELGDSSTLSWERC